ncbi:proton-coupled folate transporter isoform X1 [Dermacentor silvarum]|uniref:proton-coupled folate transporter isoform X1 n=1 Tax=Dermacentor silvarum TaxID=543639 RepID=UPI00189AC843|nr:proton-coupled folate transporter isoform X1 [Dermacentor silvarum]XP_049515045.1 proton-coupled folate transporter isoform X1 [Dermacentor silvarum]XP_049515046.1 proton-coupled folate transporter isoform X1 [Dermacentor silvarum]
MVLPAEDQTSGRNPRFRDGFYSNGERRDGVAHRGPVMKPISEDRDVPQSTQIGDVNVVPTPPLCRRVIDAVLAARVETFLAVYLVSRFMIATPVQDLLLRKACLNELHMNASVCARLDENEPIKDAAERISSTASTVQTIVAMAPSSVVAIFIGPWCDKYGYRLPLVVATLGFLASTALTLMTVYRMEMPLYANILCSIPDGLCGGPITVFAAVHSVVAVTTGVKGRRARFFGLSMVIVVFITVGGFLGGQLYGHWGLETVLGVSLAFASLALLWAFLAIEDLVRPAHVADGTSLKLRNLFQVNNLCEGFKCSIKARPQKGRAQILCLFGATCGVVFEQTSKPIDYYYVREMYSWSVAQYTSVQTVSSLVCLALYVPLIYLFLRVFKISDPGMALVGVFFASAQMAVLGLAYTEWLYYLSHVVGIPTFLAKAGIRTHLSKLVGDNEVGKVFAFLSSLDTLVPLAANVLLTWLFNVSITFMPGLPYLATAGITGIAIGLMGYVTKVHRQYIPYEGMPDAEAAPATASN